MCKACGNHNPTSFRHFINEETEAPREEKTSLGNAAGRWWTHFKNLGVSSMLTCLPQEYNSSLLLGLVLLLTSFSWTPHLPELEFNFLINKLRSVFIHCFHNFLLYCKVLQPIICTLEIRKKMEKTKCNMPL